MNNWILYLHRFNGDILNLNELYYQTLPNTLKIVNTFEYGILTRPKLRISGYSKYDLITYDNEKKIARYAEII